MLFFGVGGRRAVLGGALSSMVVLGCWQVETGAGGGGAGGSSTTDTAWSGTDLEVCGAACNKLIACGAELDVDACKQSCGDVSNAALASCFRSAGPSCDPLASCVWLAICGAAPSGASSCIATADCGALCGGSPSSACGCQCAAQAASSASSTYYAVAICANVHCTVECGSSGDPTSCQTCLTTSCATPLSKCQ